jgi:hypothetical protein
MTLLWVAESWSLSANCGAHAEYAYWELSVCINATRTGTYIGSTCQRNGGRGDNRYDPRLLVRGGLLQFDHGRQSGGVLRSRDNHGD